MSRYQVFAVSAAAVTALALSASVVGAQPPRPEAVAGYEVPPENTGGLYPVSGEPIFAESCASCHEPAIDRAPTRQEMSAMSPESLYDILKTGIMAPMAADLDEGQVYGVVRYLTGRSPTPGATRPADTFVCVENTPLQPNGPSWNGWSPDVTNYRYQPEPGIAAEDVPQLDVKWAFSYPGTKNSQPVIFGDRVYVASMGGLLYSLDTDTGCVHWRFDFGGGSRATVTIGENDIADSGYALYIGDDRTMVRALDAQSGDLLWEVKTDEHIVARITGSPILYEDILYVPMSYAEESQGNVGSYGCCTSAGTIIALNVRDGSVAWRTRILKDPPRPTRLNSAGTQMYGPAGGSIWSAPTVDPERGNLLMATGDSFTEIEHPSADAIIAMDLKTGEIQWVNQVYADDNFVSGRINAPLGDRGPDWDFGQSPIVITTPSGRDLVVTANKSSAVFAMDPVTGETVWTSEGPDGMLGQGGAAGGAMWGSAYDGMYYYTVLADRSPPPRGNPGIFALDPETGRTVWHTPAPRDVECNVPSGSCSARFDAAVSAIPGAVFAGGRDGHLRAYDSETGETIWDFDTAPARMTVTGEMAPGGSMSMGGPTFAGGMMFVHSGYNGSAGANNLLMAFTVGGE